MNNTDNHTFMLELTPTQSKIVEALKTWPKTAYDLEQELDRGKDFSADYVKVMIHKINKKRRIIDSYYRDGQRYWRLLESEEHVEYQILAGVQDLLEDGVELRESLAEATEEVRRTGAAVGATSDRVDMVDKKIDTVGRDARETPYRAAEGLYIRTNWVIVLLLGLTGILLFAAGYFLGVTYWNINIEVTPEVIEMLQNQ